MTSRKLTGLLIAGAIAVAGASLVTGASNAQLSKYKPGLWNPFCAAGFAKTQSNHSYTCYRNFLRVCKKGKIKGMPQVVQTGANTFQIRYTCTNPPH
jgi:hypothetical protein